jgi:hypothetical protein
MKTSIVVFLLVLAHFASASVVEFIETFDGNGDYDSVNGTFSGLDNPEWRIIGDGKLREAGLAIVNKGPFDFGEVSDRLRRTVIGRGSFSERIEIKSPYLGELNDSSAISSAGTIILNHYLDLRDEQRFNTLFMIVAETPETKEGEWTVSLYSTGPQGLVPNLGTSVPQGPHIALEIHYDDVLSQASFTYDNDINDNISALTFAHLSIRVPSWRPTKPI